MTFEEMTQPVLDIDKAYNSVCLKYMAAVDREDYIAMAETSLIMSCISKQKPLNPIRKYLQRPFASDLEVCQCPSCFRRLRTKKTMVKGDPYCVECGQKINWEEESK